jgi:hypothetical protein
MKRANQSIREYAKQYVELARSPAQDEKRRLWRRLNSFHPTSMIANGLDEDLVRSIIKRDFEVLKKNHCVIDVTLKDVETIAGKPENMIRWVEIVRQMSGQIFGS